MVPRFSGGLAALAVAVTMLGSAGCSTSDSPFRDTGGLLAAVRYTDLGVQASSVAKAQVIRFEVVSAQPSGTDVPAGYDYVATPPCLVAATPSGDGDLRRCGVGSLTLEAGAERTVTFRIDISRIDAIRAVRPDLPDTGDFDGDGVPNASDNCKIQDNPDQAVVGDSTVGAACATDDGAGNPLSDQDLDGVYDGLDNCLWVPNADQADADGNGIGDACDQTMPTPLPSGDLVLECTPAAYTVAYGGLSLFIVDFTPALSCDLSAGTCTLDPAKVTVRQSSQTADEGIACTLIP